jgi:very-short-patch-repair endonuclease
MIMKPSTPLNYARAKRMRSEPVDAERKLWGALRNRTLGGLKFYRQVPIGPYIVDFVCHAHGVVVELDGGTHGEDREIAHDESRTRYLESRGLKVHRVNNSELYRNIGAALDGIYAVVTERAVVPKEMRHWLPKGPHPPTALRQAPPSPRERGRSE